MVGKFILQILLQKGVVKISSTKDKSFPIRLTVREAEIASFISELSGLSQAEIFRIGLSLIARDEKPSENQKLKKYFSELKEIDNGS